MMLALVDTFHLISSALTFSIAKLSPAYSSYAWCYIVPYSLPVAQVCLKAHFTHTLGGIAFGQRFLN